MCMTDEMLLLLLRGLASLIEGEKVASSLSIHQFSTIRVLLLLFYSLFPSLCVYSKQWFSTGVPLDTSEVLPGSMLLVFRSILESKGAAKN